MPSPEELRKKGPEFNEIAAHWTHIKFKDYEELSKLFSSILIEVRDNVEAKFELVLEKRNDLQNEVAKLLVRRRIP